MGDALTDRFDDSDEVFKIRATQRDQPVQPPLAPPGSAGPLTTWAAFGSQTWGPRLARLRPQDRSKAKPPAVAVAMLESRYDRTRGERVDRYVWSIFDPDVPDSDPLYSERKSLGSLEAATAECDTLLQRLGYLLP